MIHNFTSALPPRDLSCVTGKLPSSTGRRFSLSIHRTSEALEGRANARIELGVQESRKLDDAESDCWRMERIWDSSRPWSPFRYLAQIYTDRSFTEEAKGNRDASMFWSEKAIWAMDKARGLQRSSDRSSGLWQRLAALQLRVGRRDDYLQTCSEAVSEFQFDPEDTARIAWACSLAPGAADAEHYKRLEGAVRSWHQQLLGKLLP